MSRYDFTSLSSQDFEDLTRDLLQAEWNVALESFKTGRDGGIDLRRAICDSGKTIVQCKHYMKSGFRKLLQDLQNTERPKIERLRPDRYVLVTSVELTPGNKDDIRQALAPFVVSSGDIIGAQDLEGLLSRFPAIERANFKLWLTSTSVIERVLHNAEICQTEFQVDRIRRKLPLFVQSGAFPRAMQMLDEGRIVIISGMPGIGKTTLAEMLLYAHLEQGFEPVVIQAEIAEGRKLFRPETKQVFYYDDFLGQTFLKDHSEYLGRNQDTALVDFMEMVQRSKHSRFILTTREHILQNALQLSERLAQSGMIEHRCILSLQDYSYGHKARILYNHLYFSPLPRPYKRAVLQGAFFLKIIKHEHFNPRLIEWLSTERRTRDVPARKYRAYISKLLKSPHDIWTHAFNGQISPAGRHILVAMYTLGEWVAIVDLEPAFSSLHRYCATKYQRPTSPGDFRAGLQEMDGAFLSYRAGYASYLNPSIREFVSSVILEDRDTAEDLIASAVRFKQIRNLWELSESLPENALRGVLDDNSGLMMKSLERTIKGPSMRWEKSAYGMTGSPVDMSMEYRISFLMEVADRQRLRALCDLAVLAVQGLVTSWNNTVPEFTAVLAMFRKLLGKDYFLANGGRALHRKTLDNLFKHLRFARASDWLELLAYPGQAVEWTAADGSKLAEEFQGYRDRGVFEERQDCTTLDEMNGLISSLGELGQKSNVDFKYEIAQLGEDIAEREESSSPLEEGAGIPAAAAVLNSSVQLVSDEDVRQMFSTLVDEG